MKKIQFLIVIVIILLCSLLCYFLNEAIKPIVIVSTIILVILVIVGYSLKKDNEYQKNLILVIGFCITILSLFVSGYVNNQQSTSQAKRDLKVKVLLDAYFRLQNVDYRDTVPPGHKGMIYDFIYLKYAESALTSIQLLANDSTVAIANLYARSGGTNHYRPLLIQLRDELRNELNLTELPKTEEYTPTVFRVFRKNNTPNDLTPEQQYQLIIKLNEFDRELIK